MIAAVLLTLIATLPTAPLPTKQPVCWPIAVNGAVLWQCRTEPGR